MGTCTRLRRGTVAMKGALLGAAIAWIAIGVLLGAVWAFETYPETALLVLFGLWVTAVGAALGWALSL